jgi:hypothetical protein
MRIEQLIELKPREEVLEVVNETVIPSLPKFVLLIVWFLIPFFFLFPLFRQGTFGVIVFFLLILSAVYFIGRAYTKWARTVLVVTDKRVVDVDQKGYFDKVVTETSFRQIDEVSYRVKGFWPTIFSFGVITIKLSGSAADIEFVNIKKPARVHNLINDLMQANHE